MASGVQESELKGRSVWKWKPDGNIKALNVGGGGEEPILGTLSSRGADGRGRRRPRRLLNQVKGGIACSRCHSWVTKKDGGVSTCCKSVGEACPEQPASRKCPVQIRCLLIPSPFLVLMAENITQVSASANIKDPSALLCEKLSCTGVYTPDVNLLKKNSSSWLRLDPHSLKSHDFWIKTLYVSSLYNIKVVTQRHTVGYCLKKEGEEEHLKGLATFLAWCLHYLQFFFIKFIRTVHEMSKIQYLLPCT